MAKMLGTGLIRASAATSWWLSGGIPAANCIAAYQPKGAASYAASKINLANPGTYNATEGVAPAWAALTGWAGNGLAWLNTGIVWPTQIPASYTGIALFSGVTTVGYKALFGIEGAGGTYFLVDPNVVGGFVRYYTGAGLLEKAPQLTAGVLCIAGLNFYRNGVADGNGAGNFTTSGFTLVLMSYRTPGGAAAAILNSGYLQAAAFYNISLTAPQCLALATAMAAL